jgi:hypothetical protein
MWLISYPSKPMLAAEVVGLATQWQQQARWRGLSQLQ